MTKLVTKSMKYKIHYNKNLYDILRDIQYQVWLIKNRATTMAYDWQQFSFSYKTRLGEYPKDKEMLGKVLTTDIYNELKDLGEHINSYTYINSIVEAVKHFENNKSDIVNGRIAIPNYKRNGSFPIGKNQIKDLEQINKKTFKLKLSLLSNKKVKQLKEEFKKKNQEMNKPELKEELSKIKTQIPITISSGGGATKILENIIDNKYRLRDSRITCDRKGAFYLSITYQLEVETKKLDKNKIMGIDLGINIPAMLAISDDDYYRKSVGDGREILDFQAQMYDRKRRLQRSRSWAGDGSRGHGRKTLMKPLDKLSGRIARFKAHKNHVWSRYIVDEAVRNKCGVIQMEDLSGISDTNSFLKTWTYYDLQEKITYKAEEKGIKVVKIKPDYTSQRCNHCGFINKENRNVKKHGQEFFKCVNCEHEDNADANAAKNIAMKDIEKIIVEQLKTQEKAYKNDLKYQVD